MEVLNTACFCQASGKGSEVGATLAPWEIYKEHQEHCRVWGKQRISEVEEGPGKPENTVNSRRKNSRVGTLLEFPGEEGGKEGRELCVFVRLFF